MTYNQWKQQVPEERDLKKTCINCYAIDKFFVEVVYDIEHNVITEVRSFRSGYNLYKYSPI
jgi:hypothetical protein